MERPGLLIKLDQFLLRLSTREKWMLLGGSAIAMLLFFYFSLIDPMLLRLKQLEGLIPRKEASMKELLALKGEYQEISASITALEKRLPGEGQFSPLSYIEENAGKNRIRSNIAYIRPLTPQIQAGYRESPVEVKVERVRLSQIVPYLSALENGPHLIRIKRLSIKTRFSDPNLLDVTFLVHSYEKASP